MSSNITPIRTPQQQDWWWQPHPEHPIWPPQGQCGPPPGCAPSPPSCFSSIAKADACWDQSQALENLVTKVVMDIFQTNPGIIPSPPPGVGSGPIRGVTDGSVATAGQVGEYHELVWQTPTTGASQSFNVPGMIIQPGDWDVEATAYMDGWPTGLAIFLNPQPPGFSNGMFSIIGSIPAVQFTGAGFLTCSSPRAQASVSVPTLVPFTMNVNFEGSGVAGVANFTMSVRRMR